jgi:hypothetical protein
MKGDKGYSILFMQIGVDQRVARRMEAGIIRVPASAGYYYEGKKRKDSNF